MKLDRVKQILGYSSKHVKRLRLNGALKATRLESGQFDYDRQSVMRFASSRRILKGSATPSDEASSRINVMYVRASRGGKDGVFRQLNRLRQATRRYCQKHRLDYPSKVFTDGHSADEGVSRSGFRSLYRCVAAGQVGIVFTISMDRIYRGERAFLEVAFDHFGTRPIFFDEIGKKLSPLEKQGVDERRAIYAEVAREIRARWADQVKDSKDLIRKSLDKVTQDAQAKLKEYKDEGRMVDYAILRTLLALYEDGVRNKSLLEQLCRHLEEFDDF